MFYKREKDPPLHYASAGGWPSTYGERHEPMPKMPRGRAGRGAERRVPVFLAGLSAVVRRVP